MQSGYRRALLAKDDFILASKMDFEKIAECTYTYCVCYLTLSQDSKCHLIN